MREPARSCTRTKVTASWAAVAAAALLLGACSGGSGDTEEAALDPGDDETTASSDESSASGEADYLIGATYDITGGGSFLGESELRATELAIQEFNAEGGAQAELIFHDGESTETSTVLAVQELLGEDVSAILGPSSTGGAMAAIPVVTEAEVPMLPAVSGVEVVEPVEERQWIFRPGQGGDLSASKVLEYLEQNDLTQLGVLYIGNAYGEDGRDAMRELAGDYGVEIAGEESFPVDATDLRSQLTNLDAAGAEAIFVHGIGAPSVAAYTNAAELGLEQPLISGHGQANSAFRDAVGDAVHGQPIVGAPILVWDELPDDHPQKEIASSFHDAYLEEYGDSPDMFAGVAYDATRMVLQAMEEAGPEPAAVRDHLEQLTDFVGVTGVFNFGPDDHAGLTSEAMVMTIATEDGWQIADYETS